MIPFTRSKPAVVLFTRGTFTLASGKRSFWKIDCDALTDEDLRTIAHLIADKAIPFRAVEGVPRGGLRLAVMLKPYASTRKADPLLIVDDVLTTGASMERMRADRPRVKGWVIFARGPLPEWVQAVFQTDLL